VILQTGGSAVGEISTKSRPFFARHFHGFERLHYPKLPALFVKSPGFRELESGRLLLSGRSAAGNSDLR